MLVTIHLVAVFFFHLCLCVDVFLSSTFFVLIKYSLLFSHTCRPQQKRVREQSDCGCCAVVVVRSLVRLFMLALCSLLFSAARAQLIFVDSFFVCRFFVYTILFIRFLGFSFSCFSFLGFSSFFFLLYFWGLTDCVYLSPISPFAFIMLSGQFPVFLDLLLHGCDYDSGFCFMLLATFAYFILQLFVRQTIVCLSPRLALNVRNKRVARPFIFCITWPPSPSPSLHRIPATMLFNCPTSALTTTTTKAEPVILTRQNQKKKSQKLNLPLTSTPTRPKGRIQIRAQNTFSISQDLILRFICNYLLIMRYAHKPMLFKLIMEYLDIFTDINTWVWKPYFVSKVTCFMHIINISET